jgi:hypothetical protein
MKTEEAIRLLERVQAGEDWVLACKDGKEALAHVLRLARARAGRPAPPPPLPAATTTPDAGGLPPPASTNPHNHPNRTAALAVFGEGSWAICSDCVGFSGHKRYDYASWASYLPPSS